MANNSIMSILPTEIYSSNYWYTPKDKDLHFFLKKVLLQENENYDEIENKLCKNILNEQELQYKAIGYMNYIYEALTELNLKKNSFTGLISRILGIDGKKKISRKAYLNYISYKKAFLEYIQEDLNDEKKLFALTNKKQLEDVIKKMYENVMKKPLN